MHELIVTVTSLIARIHESAFKGVGILLSCPIHIEIKAAQLTRLRPSHNHRALAYDFFCLLLFESISYY